MTEPSEVKDWVTPAAERRKRDRRPFSCTAYLRLPTQQVIEVRAVDLSTGGIGFVSPRNLQPGWVCGISFRVVRESFGVDDVVAQGRVAYSVLSGRQGGFVVGLQFVDLAPRCREVLERHAQRRGLEPVRIE